MKSPMVRLFQRDKEKFLQWWRIQDSVLKTLFVIYALFELLMVIFTILIISDELLGVI